MRDVIKIKALVLRRGSRRFFPVLVTALAEYDEARPCWRLDFAWEHDWLPGWLLRVGERIQITLEDGRVGRAIVEHRLFNADMVDPWLTCVGEEPLVDSSDYDAAVFETRERAFGVDSDIFTRTYRLHGQLRSWFAQPPDLPAGQLTHTQLAQWAKAVHVRAAVESAEDGFRALIGQHPGASGVFQTIVDVAIDAHVLFLRAKECTNFVRTGSWESTVPITTEDLMRLRSAYEDLRGCIGVLGGAMTAGSNLEL